MSKIILKTGRRKTTVPRRVILQAVRDAVSSAGSNQGKLKGDPICLCPQRTI